MTRKGDARALYTLCGVLCNSLKRSAAICRKSLAALGKKDEHKPNFSGVRLARQGDRAMNGAYQPDLAYIHDAGFGGLAGAAATMLVDALHRRGVDRGLVIDLGCGSGILSQAVSEAGYDALGIDISEAMVAIVRTRAPARSSVCSRSLEPRCLGAWPLRPSASALTTSLTAATPSRDSPSCSSGSSRPWCRAGFSCSTWRRRARARRRPAAHPRPRIKLGGSRHKRGRSEASNLDANDHDLP